MMKAIYLKRINKEDMKDHLENINQRLIEVMADFLDSEETTMSQSVYAVKDPIPREESELHIRMARAALMEYEKTVSGQPDLPAPNTVMWWLCRIADPEIRRKAVELAFKDIPYTGKGFAEHMVAAISGAFGWIVEDVVFWNEAAHSDPLPEPEFKEYLELRK